MSGEECTLSNTANSALSPLPSYTCITGLSCSTLYYITYVSCDLAAVTTVPC